jgi:hypothetical protein
MSMNGFLLTTVVEFKINIKQEEEGSLHQQSGHKCNDEYCEIFLHWFKKFCSTL